MPKPKKTQTTYTSPTAQERMRSIVERVERLTEERKALASDIKDIYAEAKSAGFDVKVLRQMVRERAMDPGDLEESIALAELYRNALGMLDGTPLGDHARKRFEASMRKPEPPADDASKTDDPSNPGDTFPSIAGEKPPSLTKPADPAPAPPPPITAEDIAAAKVEGTDAQKAGVNIVKNPYPFGDPRRAAWDEGFCASAGSDGMEVPDAWRRKPRKPDDQGQGKPA